ncbi:hypothetical protein KR215_001184, partial [Drosophila sulfurigaster]
SSTNDNFNADELNPPAWMNEQFFKDILTQYSNDPDVKVLDYKISPATAKGDHYASIMFRANVDYSTQEKTLSKSLIIKTMPEEEGHKKDFLDDTHVFPTEIAMYTEILPKFEEILSEADIIIPRWVKIIREYRENRQEDAYYVLCHGDFHLKNMMFRGTDCMLLDFQLSYVGSITNDVLYAVYMILSAEDRRYKLDELIYHYFITFANTL